MNDSDSQQLAAFLHGEAPMTWDIWALHLKEMTSLTELGKQYAVQALECFRDFFGEGYLEKCRGYDHPLFSFSYPMSNDTPGSVRNLFDLYAHIELAKRQQGKYRFVKEFTRNRTAEAWRHAIIQMELVGFAARRGYLTELEPKLTTGNKGDVAVSTSNERLFFEVLSTGTDLQFRRASRFYDEMMEFLRAVSHYYSLEIIGGLKACPSDKDQVQLQEAIVAEIEEFSLAGTMRVVANNYVSLTIKKVQNPTYPKLSGVPTETDTLGRLQDRIRQKGRQSVGAKSVWLRFNEGSGMWLMTPWAAAPLKEKLEIITPLIQNAIHHYPHISGLVMSNGWAVDGGQNTDTTHILDGHVALRRSLPGGRVKETIIVRRDKSGRRAAQELYQWYADEPTWLDWALHYLGLPWPSELIVGPPD